MLITDHNVRETLDIIDRAYIIHEGQVLKEGRPDEIVGDAMCAGSISANASRCKHSGAAAHGADTTTRYASRPVAGHDAAIAAGDQAAAAFQSRTRRPMSSRSSNAIRCSSATKANRPRRSERDSRQAAAAEAPERSTAIVAREFLEGRGYGCRAQRSLTRKIRSSPRLPVQQLACRLDDRAVGRLASMRWRRAASNALSSQAPTLKDHLTDQLTIAALEARQAVDRRGADRCDRRSGYLRAELHEVAERLGAPLEVGRRRVAGCSGFRTHRRRRA